MPESDTNAALTKELAALRRTVTKLTAQNAPPANGDFTINSWCAHRRIARASWYNLQKAGKGPRTIQVNGIIRITREADQEWAARWSVE